MRRLEKEFEGKGEVKGHFFKQLVKGNNAFLYEVNIGHLKYYEVFKLKVSRTRLGGDLMELYPKAESFGKWALTTDKLCRAKDIFEKYENSKPFKVPELV